VSDDPDDRPGAGLTHHRTGAITAIVVSTAVYFILFRKELGSLAGRSPVPEVEQPDDDCALTAAEALELGRQAKYV